MTNDMDERVTTEMIIRRMTDPVLIEKRKQEKEENELNDIQAKRIGL